MGVVLFLFYHNLQLMIVLYYIYVCVRARVCVCARVCVYVGVCVYIYLPEGVCVCVTVYFHFSCYVQSRGML